MHDRVAYAPIKPPPAMRAVVGLVALATIAAIVAIWMFTPTPPPSPARPLRAAQRVLPPTILPPVEPTEYADIDPETAREINAAVPFSTDPNPAARPFILKLPDLDRARAQDCLAAAMLYEAGSGDPEGQRAVAQVVINRMRHPAFPATICGVVFQGQERRTGCQFTFTCDGALIRRPSPEIWEDTRNRRGRDARRRGLPAGRSRDPLPHRLGGALLELQPRQGHRGQHPFVLPLDRLVGHARRIPRPPHQSRAGNREDRLPLRSAPHGSRGRGARR